MSTEIKIAGKRRIEPEWSSQTGAARMERIGVNCPKIKKKHVVLNFHASSCVAQKLRIWLNNIIVVK